jgi:DNA repair exonuclease SbcCD ATPase subunit
MYKNFNDYIKKHNNEYNELKKQTSRAIKFYENKINELFRKINVISEYDMAKDESKPNLEYFKIPDDMVNSLEQKLSERIEELENKTKLNEENIFSIKRDIVTIKNINESISKLSRTNQDSITNIVKDMDTKIKALNSKIDDEAKKLKDVCDNNYNNNKNEISKKYNDLNDKLNKIIDDMKKNNKKINYNSIGNDKLNDLNNDLKDYINKGINDTERYLKSMINRLNIDEINKRLSEINEELNQNKLLKKDLELLNNKISDVIEKKIIELFQKLDAQSTDINLCNDTCTKTVKMVEYLSGQLVQTYQPDLENNNKINYNDLKQNVEMASYMTKDLFKEEKNKLLKKIEKTLEVESENYMFIKKVDERLNFFVSENELRNMEQCFLNLLEEVK